LKNENNYTTNHAHFFIHCHVRDCSFLISFSWSRNDVFTHVSTDLIEFPFALLVGLLGPLTSSLATGMPPFFPTALSMTAEGMVAVGVASYLFHTKKFLLWLALPVAIIGERITRVIMILLIFPIFGLPAKEWSIVEITTTLPGIALQFTLIPLVLFMLWKSKIIERKLWWKIS
jgi:hypothetical protein